ncbi:hypothetical protein [Caldisalinibacter kiritimatiensis]|nr:hypothetical protein [Caldisalinibacter kiritimatiensis]
MTKKFNLRSLYLYLVCLITLIIFIVSLIQTVDNLMDVVLVNDGYIQTYEIYKEKYRNRGDNPETVYSKTEEEIQKEYDAYVEREQDRQKRMNIKGLVSSISAALIAGAFWIYHWRKVQKEKDE